MPGTSSPATPYLISTGVHLLSTGLQIISTEPHLISTVRDMNCAFLSRVEYSPSNGNLVFFSNVHDADQRCLEERRINWIMRILHESSSVATFFILFYSFERQVHRTTGVFKMITLFFLALHEVQVVKCIC
jgi:hypothetical protein